MNFDKKKLYRQIFFVSLPIIIQNILDAAVNSADVLMMNYVGQTELSAVSLAAQITGIVFMVLFGFSSGITIMAAQYWGKKDLDTIHKVQGIAMRYVLIIAVIGSLLCLFAPNLLMRIYTNEAPLIELGSQYLKIFSVAIIFWSICTVYGATLRSIGRVTIVTVVEAMTLILNVGLNAVFIFGLLGAPKMGVAGVAVATAISRIMEFIVCVIISINSKDIKLKFRYAFEVNTILRKDFIKMAMPAIANDIVWTIGFSMYSVIFGHLGEDVVAANSITSTIRGLGTTLCYGIGSASGIILGPVLGAGKIEEGKKTARTLLNFSWITGAIGGLIVLLIYPYAVTHANLSATALSYLKFMLKVNVVYITGTAVNTTLIAGVFRAGGNTRFGLVCDFIDMWIYAVPVGLIAAFVLKLPVPWVYVLLCTDEFVKWPWVFKYYRSGKWAVNITRDNLNEDKEH